MGIDLSVSFTGIRFENPFMLASAPPTESESNILRAFEAGWGGVVTKTIGMHPVVNVAGPKTKFLRHNPESATLSMNRGRTGVLHSSWNWELISDKPLDWWLPRIRRIKTAFPHKVLIASIMAGSGSDTELDHWRTLATACQDAGADGLELNLSCPHMDRADMGSNIGKDHAMCSFVTQVVKEVATRPRLGEADARDQRHRRRGRSGLSRGRRCDHVFEHLPITAARGSRDARVRNARGRLCVERRDGRPRHPAAVAREDGAAHPRLSRQGVLRDWRHLRLRTRAQLFPARVRHRPGVHGGDARSGDWTLA